jgi:hypothetical protein
MVSNFFVTNVVWTNFSCSFQIVFGILDLDVGMVGGGLEMMVFCRMFKTIMKWCEFSNWLVMVCDVQF